MVFWSLEAHFLRARQAFENSGEPRRDPRTRLSNKKTAWLVRKGHERSDECLR